MQAAKDRAIEKEETKNQTTTDDDIAPPMGFTLDYFIYVARHFSQFLDFFAGVKSLVKGAVGNKEIIKYIYSFLLDPSDNNFWAM